MRFSLGATALAAAVLFTSAAWGQVESLLYSASPGGVSTATVNITSRGGSRVRTGGVAISQHGGSADATVEVRAVRGASVNAHADAVTAGGQATAVNRSVGRGNSVLNTEAVAESIDGNASARINAKGVADRTSRTWVTGSSRVLGNGSSQVDAVARARRGSQATAIATGVVQRVRQPGEVLQRVEAQATDGGRSVSSGNAHDLD